MINHEFIIPKSKKKKSKGPEDPLELPRLMMIVGGTGQGKTTVAGNLLMALNEKYDWDEALYVTGNNKDEFLKSLEMPITTSPKDLDDFITKVNQTSDEPKYNVLVLDDIQGSPDFNIMLGRSNFAKFVLSHRHYGKVDGKGGTWVIALAQTLKNSYTPTFRKMVSNWFTFYPRDEDEISSIEKVSGDKMKMKKAMALQRLEGKHAFLFINKDDPSNIMYFMGFDRELNVN